MFKRQKEKSYTYSVFTNRTNDTMKLMLFSTIASNILTNENVTQMAKK